MSEVELYDENKADAFLFSQSRQGTVRENLSQREPLGFGFCGAHRTGKTTLCDVLAAQNTDFTFVQTNVTAIQKEMNFEFGVEKNPIKILAFQEAVIDTLISVYELQESFFFADRTPIDVAAYTLAHFGTDEYSNPEVSKRVEVILNKCALACNKYFAQVYCLQPGIEFVAQKDKPTVNGKAYQEKIAALCMGFAQPNVKNFLIIPRKVTDITERAEIVTRYIGVYLSDISKSIRNLPMQ